MDNGLVGCVINGKRLLINTLGEVWYVNKRSIRLIPNVVDTSKYNRIWCNGKRFLRHRLIGYVFLQLDLTNKQTQIDHIDRDKTNNNLSNLRIVSVQQNGFNKSNTKGYYQSGKKYRAVIRVATSRYHLGNFKTREEAHNAYLEAKKIYHTF
jgi:hypothetical protein